MQPATARHIDNLLALPRGAKKILAVAADASSCVLTVWLAICFRFESWVSLSGYQWLAVIISIALAIPLLTVFGFYHTVIRFLGRETLTAALRAFGFYVLIYSAIFTAYGLPLVPRTIGLIQPVLLFVVIGASRLFAQHIFLNSHASEMKVHGNQNALIYGTGAPAQQLALSLKPNTDLNVVGFVDTDEMLKGGQIQGLNVYHTKQLSDICAEKSISHMLLAKPELTRSQRNAVLQLLSPLNIAIRTLPSIEQWAVGTEQSADQLRELDIEDLLGRDPVAPDPQLLSRNVKDQCVLITGAGGSIGSELARQVLRLGASKLVLFDSSEFALYTIDEELQKAKSQNGFATVLVPVLGNCCNLGDLTQCFENHRPVTVFHTAAYKHVPIVEFNVNASVRNNILGTHQTALVAMEYGTKFFTLISTDKAVRPTNVMGATKRVAELCIHLAQKQALEKELLIRYSMVRFGNVLGSSGSVVPKFRAQIVAGGPITLTHPEITRYFMTIPEAAQLVIQAAAMSVNQSQPSPDTYLLDMGESVRIQDLARSMIRLSGQQIRDDSDNNSGIEIIYTGIRPGEKLYEELLVSGESKATINAKIFQDTSSLGLDLLSQVQGAIKYFQTEDSASSAPMATVQELKKLVPEFTPDSRTY